jgi:hypothetical protein
LRNSACVFQQTVGKGTLAVVNVGDYAEISNVLHGCEYKSITNKGKGAAKLLFLELCTNAMVLSND